MKYYIAKYKDENGIDRTLPPQTKKQLDVAFDHLMNVCDCDATSWVETFVYEE